MRNTIRFTACLLAAASLWTLVGCAPRGRVLGDDEELVVGSERGGQVTYDALVRKTTTELLAEHRAEPRAQGKMTLAFVGLQNKSAEELRDFHDALYDNIASILVEEKLYTLISNEFVKAAMREAGIRSPEQLFLARYKEAFLGVLAKQGKIPDYLLWARVTSKTSEASGTFSDTRDRTYQMTLEMVNANTGETVASKQGTFSKRYER